MQTCETCAHWKAREDVIGQPDNQTVAEWRNQGKVEQLDLERQGHVCTQGWFSVYQNVDEAYYNIGIHTDYSTGLLITPKDFGCIHHSPSSHVPTS